MMARLLRKTVSAFNSSSSINVQTDNLGESPLWLTPPPQVKEGGARPEHTGCFGDLSVVMVTI